jgi:hypothetical protein
MSSWIPFSHIGPAKPTMMTLAELRNFRNTGSYAVGGTVSEGLMLRKPINHGMAGMTPFEHGGRSQSLKSVEPNFAQATFAQGGYFPEADHRLI